MRSNRRQVFTILFILTFVFSFNFNGQLRNRDNQADYIIITPALFADAIQPLVSWRQDKGVNISAIELQQILTEFPDSTAQSSVRDFVSHALTYWDDPKPRFLLLVGNAQFIPSYKVPSFFAEHPSYHEDSVSIDEWYAVNIFEEDTEPDIAIGRLPVNDEQELNNVIQKTIWFEDSLELEDYYTDFLFMADKQDSFLFEREVERFVDGYLPVSFSMDSIFMAQDSTIEQSRAHLFSALNNDVLFFSYYGHGAPYQFSRYNIFSYSDIDTAKINGKPFILTSAACSQPFDAANDSSMVRQLIVQPGSGTVASVNSTGLNLLGDGSQFLAAFYGFYFNTPGITIGEALLNAKLEVHGFPTNALDAIERRYTLLGDPALKLPVFDITHIVKGEGQIPAAYTLYQNYPNPFNPSTTIKYFIPKTQHVTIKVYDILGREIAVLVNERQQAGEHSLIFNGQNLSSGIYFYRMKTGDFSAIRKSVLTK